ncbi:MAG TPA: hypothetical protein V6D03_03145 [Candidatus Caenarcaniphilales bacterium]
MGKKVMSPESSQVNQEIKTRNKTLGEKLENSQSMERLVNL